MPEHAAHHAAQHAGHKATNGLQKKIGPLPLWAWIVIVGGTIGIVLYRRNKTTATTTTDPNIDPATGLTWAQEAQQAQQGGGTTTGDTSGGGTGGGGTDPALADALGQIATEIGLQGTGGVTDTSTPVQTFGGEITDVGAGISALQQAFPSLFAQAPGSAPHKPKLTAAGAIRAPSGPTKPAARKGFTIKGLGSGNWEYVPTKKTKHNGSGSAGHAGKPKTVSRTTHATHTPTKAAQQPRNHHTPPPKRVVRGHKKPRRLGP